MYGPNRGLLVKHSVTLGMERGRRERGEQGKFRCPLLGRGERKTRKNGDGVSACTPREIPRGVGVV